MLTVVLALVVFSFQVNATTTVVSDGSTARPYCSWSKSCSWTSDTKAICAAMLCQASGLRGGTFVDASGSICSTSAVSGSTNLMLFDTGEFKLGDFRTKAKITAACDDAVSASAEDVGSTTTVTSDGSELAPYCSWSSSCSWTSSTKLKCATGLCQAAGYVAGTFVSASNNMCTSSWVTGNHALYVIDKEKVVSADFAKQAQITAVCSSSVAVAQSVNVASTSSDEKSSTVGSGLAGCKVGAPIGDSASLQSAESGSLCVFPFRFKGVWLSGCTTRGSDGQPWCPTTLTASSEPLDWGFCDMRGCDVAPEDPTTSTVATTADTCAKYGWKIMGSGSCPSVSTNFIRSKDECSAAAAALDINGGASASQTTSSVNPTGCYIVVGTGKVYFNPTGSESNSLTSRVSVCSCGDGDSAGEAARETEVAANNFGSSGCGTPYSLMTAGKCAAGSSYLKSQAACSAAASALGLPYTIASLTSSTVNPYGCYMVTASGKIYFNPKGSLTNTATTRVSLCSCNSDIASTGDSVSGSSNVANARSGDTTTAIVLSKSTTGASNPGCKDTGVEVMQSGSCPIDANGFITSQDECSAAGRALGLFSSSMSTASLTRSSVNPFGCYILTSTGKVYFNPIGSRSNGGSTRVSVCSCGTAVTTENPSVVAAAAAQALAEAEAAAEAAKAAAEVAEAAAAAIAAAAAAAEQLGCEEVGLEVMTAGSCPADTNDFISTKDECLTAVTALKLPTNVVSQTQSSTNPFGCYIVVSTGKAYFNPIGSRDNTGTARLSICSCGPATTTTTTVTVTPFVAAAAVDEAAIVAIEESATVEREGKVDVVAVGCAAGADVELMTTGSCPTDTTGFIGTQDECSAAAGALKIGGGAGARRTQSVNNPLGCYLVVATGKVYYNPIGSASNVGTARISVCTCGATAVTASTEHTAAEAAAVTEQAAAEAAAAAEQAAAEAAAAAEQAAAEAAAAAEQAAAEAAAAAEQTAAEAAAAAEQAAAEAAAAHESGISDSRTVTVARAPVDGASAVGDTDVTYTAMVALVASASVIVLGLGIIHMRSKVQGYALKNKMEEERGVPLLEARLTGGDYGARPVDTIAGDPYASQWL